jgi:hypothetical protein
VHATLPGLRQRYYYRGKFSLLELYCTFVDQFIARGLQA